MIPRGLRRLYDRVALRDPQWRFLFEPGPEDEVVVFDCETTGLDVARDDIITIAAVKVRGNRILTSEKFEAVARPDARMNPAAIKVHRLLESDVRGGGAIAQIIPDFLRFIGGRPLVGYYLEFDVAMVEKYVKPLTGVRLPNPMIEVSALYYDRKYGNAPPGTHVDLSFAHILRDLGLPALDQHDAFNDAVMTAEMYVALNDLKARGVRISRERD
ncbi:MAG: 3'-5' exonuclease [Beijerinckiaceae bacterium]